MPETEDKKKIGEVIPEEMIIAAGAIDQLMLAAATMLRKFSTLSLPPAFSNSRGLLEDFSEHLSNARHQIDIAQKAIAPFLLVMETLEKLSDDEIPQDKEGEIYGQPPL